MKDNQLGNKIKRNVKNLLLICCVLLTFTFILVGVSANSNTLARAATLDELPYVLADSNVLEDIFSSGTQKQVEGKVQEDIGTVKRNLGKVTGQSEGAAEQLQGKLKQTQGEAQRRLERASAEMERASENLSDAIKEILGQD